MSEISYEIFDNETIRGENIPSSTVDYVRFSGITKNYCIGFIDIVGSTKVTAKIQPSKLGMYYSIFLNSMSEIVVRFGGKVVKNMGDSILFYFPKSVTKKNIEDVIKCGVAMLDAKILINQKLLGEGIPSIKYRISLDYGTVSTACSSSSSHEDIFGPPVNVCVKINHSASPNGIVIGSDLFRLVKDNSKYKFSETYGFSSGLKNEYIVYALL